MTFLMLDFIFSLTIVDGLKVEKGRARVVVAGGGGTRTGLLGGCIEQNVFEILIKVSSLDESIVAQS